MITKSKFRIFGNLFVGLALLFTGACATLTITDVDFSEPMESVLEVGANGMVQDVEKGLSFNILPIQEEETGVANRVMVEEVRIIRGKHGHYFIIAPGFRNVYVFNAKNGELVLERKILVDENGVANPAFNQRSTHIQLIDGTSRAFNLTHEGLRN